jgi:hypothetical protein
MIDVKPVFHSIGKTEKEVLISWDYDESGVLYDEAGYTYDGLTGTDGLAPLLFKVENKVNKLFYFEPTTQYVTGTISFNQTGISFNNVGVTFGGLYGFDGKAPVWN